MLRGGGRAVGDWAREHGFGLSVDAPEVLDFYAARSPIFMAASFDARRAETRGQRLGDGTPIHLTIPTGNPWVPLRILGLGHQPADPVQADVYLLTDRRPAMLPHPEALGASGVALAQSGPASAQLLADLRSDKGMGWLPASGMWLSYLRIDSTAGALTHDLAVDASGRHSPSPVAAGLAVPASVAGTGDGRRGAGPGRRRGVAGLAGGGRGRHRRPGRAGPGPEGSFGPTLTGPPGRHWGHGPRPTDLEGRLLRPASPERFGPAELDGLPEPVRRHLAQAIAPGTPLATAARLRMRGAIKVGRWLPFRARQVLNPHHGFVWTARAAGLIAGSDRYLDGAGAMDWKLAGLVTVAAGDGPDVSRSAAGRAGAEGVWLPTALLPRFGVRWSAPADDQVTAPSRWGRRRSRSPAARPRRADPLPGLRPLGRPRRRQLRLVSLRW